MKTLKQLAHWKHLDDVLLITGMLVVLFVSVTMYQCKLWLVPVAAIFTSVIFALHHKKH